jgi:hypothetical protein
MSWLLPATRRIPASRLVTRQTIILPRSPGKAMVAKKVKPLGEPAFAAIAARWSYWSGGRRISMIKG